MKSLILTFFLASAALTTNTSAFSSPTALASNDTVFPNVSITLTTIEECGDKLVELQRAMAGNTTLTYQKTSFNNFSTNCQTLDYDIVVVDKENLQLAQECLLNLASFNLTNGMHDLMVQESSFEQRIVGIPWHIHHNGLFYNRQLMLAQNYSVVPKTMLNLTEMLSGIMKKNSDVDGFTMAFNKTERLMDIVAEWAVNKVEVNKPINLLSVFKQLQEFKAFFNLSDIANHTFNSWSKFNSNKTIVAYDTLAMLNSQIPSFNFTISGFPTKVGHHSAFGGHYLGVSKNSKNTREAVRVLREFASMEYQRSISSNSAYSLRFTTPTFPSLWNGTINN